MHTEMEAHAAVEWTEDRIMALTRAELVRLWTACPAVEMAELDGEYKGLVPNKGNKRAEEAYAKVLFDENSPRGYWLGKAFAPRSSSKGDGYNRWRRPDGSVDRYMRFATEMGTSLIDGKPALLMYYGAYRHRFVPEGKSNTLIDEIRKLADGVYLGLATTEATDGSRTTPDHFVLLGPTGRYIGVDDPAEELI
ncbi:MAG: hypothetical protein OXR73_38155 [Myxococcales bacterium]|nr:hypothetical protein [Myxococcales bacterium]